MFPKSFEPVSVVMDGTVQDGWSEPPSVTSSDVAIPAQSVGLHYGQIAFEGLRARSRRGRNEAFRPDLHWERLCRSMSRLAMPPIGKPMFDTALGSLLEQIPQRENTPDEFLYVRPLVIGTDPDWGMGGSNSFRLIILAGWTREAFSRVPRVVALVEADRRRSWPGGTGDVKIPANYGPAFSSQRSARAVGAHTVLWLDPEQRHVEEFSSMNALFVDEAGTLVAPRPGTTVLDGVTRRSIVELALDAGISVNEGPMRWPEPSEETKRGVLLATGTAAGMAVVDEVKERPASGAVSSWQSTPTIEALTELRALTDACFWGAGRSAWWTDSDELLSSRQ